MLLEDKVRIDYARWQDRNGEYPKSPCCNADPVWELDSFQSSSHLAPGLVGFSYFGNPRCPKCLKILKTTFASGEKTSE